MGVIDRKNLEKHPSEGNQVTPAPSEDELSIPELSDASSVTDDINIQPSTTRPRSFRQFVHFCAPSKPSKHCGKRRLRHYRAVEDLRLTWNDSSDEALELSIHDFMNVKPSPFAILLQDNTLLKAWWEFISKPEERCVNVEESRKCCGSNESSPPLMPPEYKRIEKSLKELLQRRSMDVNMVQEVEIQLAAFFLRTPKEILKIKKLTQYEITIKTAICQYHGLHSDMEQSCRKRNDLFISLLEDEYTHPTTALHDYLTQRQNYYSVLCPSK